MLNNQSDIRSDKNVRIHTVPIAAAGKTSSCALQPHEKFFTALVAGDVVLIITILSDWPRGER